MHVYCQERQIRHNVNISPWRENADKRLLTTEHLIARLHQATGQTRQEILQDLALSVEKHTAAAEAAADASPNGSGDGEEPEPEPDDLA